VTTDGSCASVKIPIGWAGFGHEWPKWLVDGSAGAHVEKWSEPSPQDLLGKRREMGWDQWLDGGSGGLPGPGTCRNVLRAVNVSRSVGEDANAHNEAGLSAISRSFRWVKCAGGACRNDRGG
jgi:ribonuclease HI